MVPPWPLLLLLHVPAPPYPPSPSRMKKIAQVSSSQEVRACSEEQDRILPREKKKRHSCSCLDVVENTSRQRSSQRPKQLRVWPQAALTPAPQPQGFKKINRLKKPGTEKIRYLPPSRSIRPSPPPSPRPSPKHTTQNTYTHKPFARSPKKWR